MRRAGGLGSYDLARRVCELREEIIFCARARSVWRYTHRAACVRPPGSRSRTPHRGTQLTGSRHSADIRRSQPSLQGCHIALSPTRYTHRAPGSAGTSGRGARGSAHTHAARRPPGLTAFIIIISYHLIIISPRAHHTSHHHKHRRFGPARSPRAHTTRTHAHTHTHGARCAAAALPGEPARSVPRRT